MAADRAFGGAHQAAPLLVRRAFRRDLPAPANDNRAGLRARLARMSRLLVAAAAGAILAAAALS